MLTDFNIFIIFQMGLINYNKMRKSLFYIALFLSTTIIAQNYPDFQDPAEWIPLEKSFNYVSTSITPRAGQLPEMYSAPIKFVPEKENDLFGLKLEILFLKYGFTEEGKEMVLLEGNLDLSCCKNKPVRLEFQDIHGNPVQFADTDDQGNFILTSPNGKLMKFNEYKLKLNFNKIIATDNELNQRAVILDWITRPSDREMKKLRKKALRDYKTHKKYIDDLRKNG